MHVDLADKLHTLEPGGTILKHRDAYLPAPTVSLSSEILLCVRSTRSIIFVPPWMSDLVSGF